MRTGIFYVKFRNDIKTVKQENPYLAGVIEGLTDKVFKKDTAYPVLAIDRQNVSNTGNEYMATFFLIPLDRKSPMMWLSSELFVYAGLKAR